MSSDPVVRPDGRPLPDVVLRVSLHPSIAAGVIRLCPEFTTVQRRLLRHFRDRTACVFASPPGTGRTTALAAGVLSALCHARDAGRDLRVTWWSGEPGGGSIGRLRQLAEDLGCVDLIDCIVFVGPSSVVPLHDATILVADDLPCTLPEPLVQIARAAVACIGVTRHAGAVHDHALALLGRTGGFSADCTEYELIRARAWAPLRNEPFPPRPVAELRVADELVRIAHSHGPARVHSEDDVSDLLAYASVLLDDTDAPAAVSGVAARQVAIVDARAERADELRAGEAGGEVVWIGAPRSVAALLGSLGASGGLRQELARVTLVARDADELAWCAAARHGLSAGCVEPCDELVASGPSRSLRDARDELLRSLADALTRDDDRCERAALWLVARYGLNRGNALALAQLERSRTSSGP